MKKTIKLIITGIVLLLASNVQAQSKEETEQWLNQYGTQITLSYIITKNEYELKQGFTKFTGFDGEFLNFYTSKESSYGASYRDSYKVLPKDILYQDISAFSENDFEEILYDYAKAKKYQLKSKAGKVFHSGKATSGINRGGSTVKYVYEGHKSEIEENTGTIYFEFAKEQSKEAIRLLKAIYHLAKLNGASDFPKVKKDTF